MHKILIAVPQSAKFWFEDTAIALALSFRSCGWKADALVTSDFDLNFKGEDYDMILTFACERYRYEAYENIDKSKVWITWMLEQIPQSGCTSPLAQKRLEIIKPYLSFYDLVLTDGSPKSTYLKNIGINAMTLNLGFSEYFEKKLAKSDKVSDIFFVGELTPRREQILKDIKRHGLNVFIPDKFVNPNMIAQYLGNTKIALNLHHDSMPSFEKHRLVEIFMSNRAFVITEEIDDDDWFSKNGYFISSRAEDLPATLELWLSDSKKTERQEIANKGYEYIKQDYQLDIFVKNISRYLEGLIESKIT